MSHGSPFYTFFLWPLSLPVALLTCSHCLQLSPSQAQPRLSQPPGHLCDRQSGIFQMVKEKARVGIPTTLMLRGSCHCPGNYLPVWSPCGLSTLHAWMKEVSFKDLQPGRQGLSQPHLKMYFLLAGRGLCCCTWALSSCGEWGLLSNCGLWAAHCGGFSCCRAWPLGAPGFSSCNSLELSSCSSRAQ